MKASQVPAVCARPRAVALFLGIVCSSAGAQTTSVVDGQDKRVYRYDAAGVPTGSFPLMVGNDNAAGVASDGRSVHVLDGTDQKIYRYDPSGGLQVVSRPLRQTAGTSLSLPGALAIDGDALWLVDRGRQKLFRYPLAAVFSAGGNLNAVQEIPLVAPNDRAEGLAIDAVYLYVLDQIDMQLYRYRRDGTGAVDVSPILRQVDGGSLGAPYGAALAGGSMFVVDGSQDQVFAYDLASLFSGSGDLHAVSESVLDPANDDARDVAVAPGAAGSTSTTASTSSTTSTSALTSSTTSSTASTTPGSTTTSTTTGSSSTVPTSATTATSTSTTTQTTLPPSASVFFVVDGQDRRVYRYDAAGVPTGSFHLIYGNDHPVGAAFDGTSVHVLDDADQKLYRYDPSGTFQAFSRELHEAAGTDLSVPGALAIDGDALWLVDRGRQKLYRYSLATAFSTGGNVNAEQEIPLVDTDARAEGLAIDALHLYVLDQIDTQLYRYRRDGTGAVDVSPILRQVDGGSLGAPYGAALTGGSMFVVDGSRDKVFAYDLAHLFSGSGNLNAVSEFVVDPANDDARDVAVTAGAASSTSTTTSTSSTTSSTASTTPGSTTTSTTTGSTSTAPSTATTATSTTTTTQTTLPPSASAFFVVDAQDETVYRYDAAGVPMGGSPLAAGNGNGHGIAFDGVSVYVLDRRDKRIYAYDPSGTFQVISRQLRQGAGTALGLPGALAIDEDALWVVDRGRHKLFRYSLAAAFPADGNVNAVQEIALVSANARAEGLALDAVYLYVLDQIDQRLYRYRRDGTGAVDASRLLKGVDGGSLRAPYGATLDGGSIFIVDGSRDKVYAYDLGSLFSDSSPVNATSKFALDRADGDARDVAVVTGGGG